MPFGNPLTQTKFYRTRDEMFWPCVSGEDYPPTFNNSSYGVYRGHPAIFVQASAGISANAIWARLYRVAPFNITSTTMHIDWKLALITLGAHAADVIRIVYGDNAGIGRGIRLLRTGNAGNWQFQTADGIGTETTDLGFGPVLNTTYKMEMILEPTAAILKIDNVVRATHLIRFWPIVITDDPSLQFAHITAPGAAGLAPQLRVMQLRVYWD